MSSDKNRIAFVFLGLLRGEAEGALAIIVLAVLILAAFALSLMEPPSTVLVHLY